MTRECPICGVEIGLPEWAQKAIVEAVGAGVASARAESAVELDRAKAVADDAISLAEYLLSYAPPFERKRALDTIAELRGL